MVPRFQKWTKKYFEKNFQNFSRFWNFGALFIVKQRFLKQTFLKRGSLEFAHICSTCGPHLPRAGHALRFDAYFCQGLPRKKVRCAYACVRWLLRHCVNLISCLQWTLPSLLSLTWGLTDPTILC